MISYSYNITNTVNGGRQVTTITWNEEGSDIAADIVEVADISEALDFIRIHHGLLV